MSIPRIRIPVHVFGFSLAIAPGIAYAYYYRKNHPSDDDFEQTLRENYQHRIKDSQSKRQDMAKFFENMKNHSPEMDHRMDQVLHGGRGEIKRHYAVDKNLYGTEQGVETKQRTEQALLQKKAGRGGGLRSTENNENSKTNSGSKTSAATVDTSSSSKSGVVSKQTVLGTVGVAVVAGAIGFLAGGSRSQ